MMQKRNMAEGIRKFKIPLLIGLVLVLWIALWGWQKWQYRKTIMALTSISPKHAILFRIYPRVGIPVDEFIEFKPPDPIITEFFQALTDHQPYSYSHDRIFGDDQQWFFEVATGEVLIQISFHIPYDNGNMVAGMLGKYNQNSTRSYGYFQSQQLYQWYQKYKDRWLTTTAPQPGAATTPTPP